ncbi:MAG: hypothetical protein ACO4B5_10835 [Steroidobacteraceae bacterium]|jgi:hypothetical protein
MSAFAFCNYTRFLTRTGGSTGQAWQNFSVNQTRTYGGITYKFAPFAVSTGAGSKGGDRSEASIGTGADPISVNLFAEAADERWLVEIKTVSLDPLSFSDGALIRSEIWRVGRPEFLDGTAVLRLTSPLDAVRDQVPNRYLTTRLVGALPTSASLVVS